ncbi:ribosome maturation factor RimP [Thiohalorhabdus methylotrophus]|uniref:Ribosome maturation factor RimP n=1 Tax=Thiohalorhabdus methylotrophus TaxID=3242694 RepID=A0ABV4TUT7_9GAMM
MSAIGRDGLIQMLEPTVRAMGYELVELELVGGSGNRVLRLFIDTPSGVTLDDCEAVSGAVEEVLDGEDPIPGEYSLEISSPGVDRPLRKDEDYQRFAGETVKIKTFGPVDGQRSFTGTLIGLEEGQVILNTPAGRAAIPREQIAKAHLVADL